MLTKFKFGFDRYGVLLFLLIMVPNIIWFVASAPNDILRNDSTTPKIDIAASICQVIMIATLCLCIRKDVEKIRLKSKWIVSAGIACLCYYVAWNFYYLGYTTSLVMLSLCLFPCVSFIFYELDRKNWISMIPTISFSILHLISGIINFI